jgi:acetolactate synthase small subunit
LAEISKREVIRRADAQQEQLNAQIKQQKGRIEVFLAFLDDTGQLEKFNEWEESRR